MLQMPGPCSDRAMTSAGGAISASLRHLFPRAVRMRNITALGIYPRHRWSLNWLRNLCVRALLTRMLCSPL